MNNDLKSNCYIILPDLEIRHYTMIIAYEPGFDCYLANN